MCGDGGNGGSSGSGYSRRLERIERENERIRQENALIRRRNESNQQANNLYDEGKYVEALVLYLEALRNLPGDEVVEQNIKNAKAMIYKTEAEAAIHQEDYERAAILFHDAQSINSKYAHLWEDLRKECESNALCRK